MVESATVKTREEPITSEEVLSLSQQLFKNRNDPENALKLLKLFDRKAVTARHLIDTKVGKSLTAVNEKPDPERQCEDTPELLQKVAHMKEHLKRKWKQVHAEYKTKQQKTATPVATSQSQGAVAASEATQDSTSLSVPRNVSIPYMPQRVDTGDQKRNTIIEKFVTKLQTPPNAADGPFNKAKLLRAVEKAQELEQAIFDMSKDNEKVRQDKFRSMLSVLIQHTHMRDKLLTEKVKPIDMVRMKPGEFLSDEVTQQRQQSQMDKMQSQRVDFQRAADMKSIGESFFTCKKCRSKKTNYYQMQTRGADEPMTNFINCLECLYSWKE